MQGLPVYPGGEIRKSEPVVQVQPQRQPRLPQHLLYSDRPAQQREIKTYSSSKRIGDDMAVQCAIIGVDFLCSHKLLVDPAANCLIYTASLQSFATVSASSVSPTASCAARSSPSSLESEASGGTAIEEAA